MKSEKLRVIRNLKKLHKKMLNDMAGWSKMYGESGAIEYMKNHNDTSLISVHDIETGKATLSDIDYQIRYIKEYVKNGDKEGKKKIDDQRDNQP